MRKSRRRTERALDVASFDNPFVVRIRRQMRVGAEDCRRPYDGNLEVAVCVASLACRDRRTIAHRSLAVFRRRVTDVSAVGRLITSCGKMGKSLRDLATKSLKRN